MEFLSQFANLKEDDNPILLIGELKKITWNNEIRTTKI